MPETPDPLPLGVVAATAALDVGWSYAQLSEEVRAGRLRRLTAGAYVAADHWPSLDAGQQHLAQAQALLATRGAEWALARRTAALAHGMDLLGALPSRPQLLRPRTADQRASSSSERVAQLPEAQVATVRGRRATGPARTVVDLARSESFRDGVVAADSALRAGLDPGELQEVLEFCRRWPGATRARQVVAFADGRAETALESISRVALRALRLPVFEPQVEVWVGERFVARVDGFWREWNVVAESDGRGKYADVRDVYREKERQDELTDLGFGVVRWGWDDAWRPRGVLEPLIERACRRASPVLDPRVRLVSTTLEEAQARHARQRPAA